MVSPPRGPENPHGNAFRAEATLLASESQAQRRVNAATSRFWRIVNHGRKNRLGQPVGYRLVPGENAPPFVQPDAAVLKRAGFAAHNLWVTPYRPERTVRRRRLPEPAPHRRRPAGLDRRRSPDRRHRPGRVVRLRPHPRAAPRGLAGDAGRRARVLAQARRLLRPEPGARCAAADCVKCRGRSLIATPPGAAPRPRGASRSPRCAVASDHHGKRAAPSG